MIRNRPERNVFKNSAGHGLEYALKYRKMLAGNKEDCVEKDYKGVRVKRMRNRKRMLISLAALLAVVGLQPGSRAGSRAVVPGLCSEAFAAQAETETTQAAQQTQEEGAGAAAQQTQEESAGAAAQQTQEEGAGAAAEAESATETVAEAENAPETATDAESTTETATEAESETESVAKAESETESDVYMAPDFTLTDQYGEEHTLSDYRGKVVFLNFWATWCPPCRAEMPDIQKLYEEFEEEEREDIAILSIAFPGQSGEQDVDGVKAFLEENGYTYPVLMDEKAETMYAYYINAFPTTFMIAKDGSLFGYVPGAMPEETMRDIIAQTLGETP